MRLNEIVGNEFETVPAMGATVFRGATAIHAGPKHEGVNRLTVVLHCPVHLFDKTPLFEQLDNKRKAKGEDITLTSTQERAREITSDNLRPTQGIDINEHFDSRGKALKEISKAIYDELKNSKNTTILDFRGLDVHGASAQPHDLTDNTTTQPLNPEVLNALKIINDFSANEQPSRSTINTVQDRVTKPDPKNFAEKVINPEKAYQHKPSKLSISMPAQELNDYIMKGVSYLAITLHALGYKTDWLKPLLNNQNSKIIMSQPSEPQNNMYGVLVKQLEEAVKQIPPEQEGLLQKLLPKYFPESFPDKSESVNPKHTEVEKLLSIMKASRLSKAQWGELASNPDKLNEQIDLWKDQLKDKKYRRANNADFGI